MSDRIRITKTSNGFKADCPCGWGIESLGHDESSRSHTKARVAEHERTHTS